MHPVFVVFLHVSISLEACPANMVPSVGGASAHPKDAYLRLLQIFTQMAIGAFVQACTV